MIKRNHEDALNILYMLFFLPLVILMSAGFGSTDRVYKYFFALCLVIWLVKIAITKYTAKEYVIFAVILALLVLNLWHNGERKLILTAMSIFALKEVNIENVFKMSFWIRLITVITNISLSLIGIRTDIVIGGMTKYHLFSRLVNQYDIHSYGYKHPNHSILYVYSVLILFLLAYGKKMPKRSCRLMAYAVCTVVMWTGYQVFEGRTAWLSWIIALVLLIGADFLWSNKYLPIFLKILSTIPVVAVVGVGIELFLVKKAYEPAMVLNYAFSGRFAYYAERSGEVVGAIICGVNPRATMDSALLNLLYNYGWVVFILFMFLYSKCIVRLAAQKELYAVVALVSALFYALTEEMLLNATINVSLLLFGSVLFLKEANNTDEKTGDMVEEHC